MQCSYSNIKTKKFSLKTIKKTKKTYNQKLNMIQGTKFNKFELTRWTTKLRKDLNRWFKFEPAVGSSNSVNSVHGYPKRMRL